MGLLRARPTEVGCSLLGPMLAHQRRGGSLLRCGISATSRGAFWSGLGLVSRVTPVHTAMRNCTRDEGWSFEVGNQVLISSHRKLLSSKAMVVNVAEKSEQDFDRYD
jgi:hypothetical protein